MYFRIPINVIFDHVVNGGERMKKYKVIANDDSMKYQVVDSSNESQVYYENDGKHEANEVCGAMNTAYEEGKNDRLV